MNNPKVKRIPKVKFSSKKRVNLEMVSKTKTKRRKKIREEQNYKI